MKRLAAVLAVLAVASVSASAKTALPKPVIPECLGVNIHFTGSEQKQVDQIADAGFRFIRMDYFWGGIEKEKGKYDFTAHDQLLATLDKRGIRAIFILDYGHPFYDEGKSPFTDEGRAAFARFAGAGAEHFKGRGVVWEIWNEPNIGIFWKPEPNVEDYVKLARAAYAAVKKADPGATVVAPALACWDFAFLENAFKLGLLDCLDAVSVHPYGSITPENATEYYATVRGLIAKYAPKGRDVPVVSGEWGYSAVKGMTVETQGYFLARELLVNLMNGVPLSIWYDWRDDGPDPNEKEHHFGTVYQDFTPKPAYIAMQTLSKELDGYTYAGRIGLQSADDYLLLFEKRGDYRLAAWTTGNPHWIKTPMDVLSADIVTWEGKRRRTDTNLTFAGLGVFLTGAPQYVEPTQKSKRWAVEAGWQADVKTLWNKGNLAARIKSRMGGTGAVLTALVGGSVASAAVMWSEHPSASTMNTLTCDAPYVYRGDPKERVEISVRVREFDEPFIRWADVDKSACPALDVLAPSNDGLLLSVKWPADAPARKGRVEIVDPQDVKLADKAADVEAAAGSDQAIVKLKWLEQPSGTFSFGAVLKNSAGKELARMPIKHYAVVDTFADGRAGEPVTKYVTETDGDANIAGTAKLTYADAPPGVPLTRCARLDYELAEGWKFARVSARPLLPIPGQPKTAMIWVGGSSEKDASGKLRFADSEGQTFQTDYDSLDFGDWRCLDASFTDPRYSHWGGKDDGVVRHPILWDTLFLMDPRKAGAKGTVYLGPLMLCYD